MNQFYARSLLTSLVAFLALSFIGLPLCLAQQDRSTPDTSPAAGEIRLEGTIQGIDAARGSLVLNTTSFTLPNGKSSTLSPAKPKVILVNGKTLLQVRDADGRKVTLAELKAGTFAIAVGHDMGSGKDLPARAIAVWDRVENGKYLFGPNVKPAAKPAEAKPVVAPPVVTPPVAPPVAAPPVVPPKPAAARPASAEAGATSRVSGLPLSQTVDGITLQLLQAGFATQREASPERYSNHVGLYPREFGIRRDALTAPPEQFTPQQLARAEQSVRMRVLGPQGEALGPWHTMQQWTTHRDWVFWPRVDARSPFVTAEFEFLHPDAPPGADGVFMSDVEFKDLPVPTELDKPLPLNREIVTARGTKLVMLRVTAKGKDMGNGLLDGTLEYSIGYEPAASATSTRIAFGPPSITNTEGAWKGGGAMSFVMLLPREITLRGSHIPPATVKTLNIKLPVKETASEWKDMSWFRRVRFELKLPAIAPLPPGATPAYKAVADDVSAVLEESRTNTSVWTFNLWLQDKTLPPDSRRFWYARSLVGRNNDRQFRGITSSDRSGGLYLPQQYWKAGGQFVEPGERMEAIIVMGTEKQTQPLHFETTVEAARYFTVDAAWNALPLPAPGQRREVKEARTGESGTSLTLTSISRWSTPGALEGIPEAAHRSIANLKAHNGVALVFEAAQFPDVKSLLDLQILLAEDDRGNTYSDYHSFQLIPDSAGRSSKETRRWILLLIGLAADATSLRLQARLHESIPTGQTRQLKFENVAPPSSQSARPQNNSYDLGVEQTVDGVTMTVRKITSNGFQAYLDAGITAARPELILPSRFNEAITAVRVFAPDGTFLQQSQSSAFFNHIDPAWKHITVEYQVSLPNTVAGAAAKFREEAALKEIAVPRRLNEAVELNQSVTTEGGTKFTLQSVTATTKEDAEGGIVGVLRFAMRVDASKTAAAEIDTNKIKLAFTVEEVGGQIQPTITQGVLPRTLFFETELPGNAVKTLNLKLSLFGEKRVARVPDSQRRFRFDIKLPPELTAAPLKPPGAPGTPATLTVNNNFVSGNLEFRNSSTSLWLQDKIEPADPSRFWFSQSLSVRDAETQTELGMSDAERPFPRSFYMIGVYPRPRWKPGGEAVASGERNEFVFWSHQGKPRPAQIDVDASLIAARHLSHRAVFTNVPVPRAGATIAVGQTFQSANGATLTLTSIRHLTRPEDYEDLPELEASRWRVLPTTLLELEFECKPALPRHAFIMWQPQLITDNLGYDLRHLGGSRPTLAGETTGRILLPDLPAESTSLNAYIQLDEFALTGHSATLKFRGLPVTIPNQ